MTSINLLLVNELQDSLPYNVFGFFATCVSLRGNLRVCLGTQRTSLRKFNLSPLATTLRSDLAGALDSGSEVNSERILPLELLVSQMLYLLRKWEMFAVRTVHAPRYSS